MGITVDSLGQSLNKRKKQKVPSRIKKVLKLLNLGIQNRQKMDDADPELVADKFRNWRYFLKEGWIRKLKL